MRIIRLEAENFKRIRAIQIHPSGNMVVIGGKNGSGKTSTLDCIQAALAGKDSIDRIPLRSGEKEGFVVVETEELIIRRTFTEAGSYLKVENKDGAQYKSPQALLDKLVGALSFDPLKFAQMDPKPQMETVRQFVGLDFSELDAKRGSLYDERAGVNRKLKDLQGSFNLKPFYEGVPEVEVSSAALLEKVDAIDAMNEKNAAKRGELQDMRDAVKTQQEDLNGLKDRIAAARIALAEMEAKAEKLDADLEVAIQAGKDFAAEVEELTDEDDTPIRDQIKNADTTNAKVRGNKERAELGRKVDETTAQADALTREIEAIDKTKAEQMAGAKFPIPGMSFDESGVLLNGLPFSQASSAEQLRASVAMGIALNPKLKVLLVRDGSLLDSDSLALLSEMASAADAQVWLEMVGNPDEAQVIIEDGEVQGAHLKAVAND